MVIKGETAGRADVSIAGVWTSNADRLLNFLVYYIKVESNKYKYLLYYKINKIEISHKI